MKDKNIYGVIYKIHNKINNKLYIGQTIDKHGFKGRYHAKGNGIERVYNYYKGVEKHNAKDDVFKMHMNNHLYSSIKKYGFGAFEVDEVFDIAYNQNELNKLEYMYIAIYNTTDPNYGYNIREGGGSSGKLSDASKIKEGIKIVCIDTNTVFKSISEASRSMNVSSHYIKSTFRKKHSFDNYKNENVIFRKLRYEYDKSKEKYCIICGCKFKKKKVKNKHRRYTYIHCQKICDKCKQQGGMR